MTSRTMIKTAVISGMAIVSALAAADDLQVTVNGQPVTFNDAAPQMTGGRVLVPLRGVFEQLGATVTWDPTSQSVIADGHGRHVRLRIGSYDANVNGHVITMDVMPEITQGSTMVPLRFLGEALGAKVDWQPQNDLVALTTMDRDHGHAQRFVATQPTFVAPAPQPRQRLDTLTFTRNTVIPITLDDSISSNGNQPGDKFTASVRGDSGAYLNFPDGAVVEGVVRAANPASGDHPGSLDVRFTHIRFPDGSRYAVSGYVAMLNDRGIMKGDDGRFIVRPGSNNSVAQGAEIGAGAGFIIGSMRGSAIGGAVVGGSIGAILGAVDHHLARNVSFDAGTRFGLVLNRNLTVDKRDLRG